MKAQRRNSFCEGQVENGITDKSDDNTQQNELAFGTLDQILRDLSLPGSSKESQDRSSRQQIESLSECLKIEY